MAALFQMWIPTSLFLETDILGFSQLMLEDINYTTQFGKNEF
jgi:hypothetical protein